MEFKVTASEKNSNRAESEVITANNFKAENKIEKAIDKYKNAIYFFIYAIEDTPKDTQKQFFQYRIKQVQELLNQAESEIHRVPSRLNELMLYASNPANKSQILRTTEALSLTSTVVYPRFDDSRPSLSKFGNYPSYPNYQSPSFPPVVPKIEPINFPEPQKHSADQMPYDPSIYPSIPIEPPSNLINSTYSPQSQSKIPQQYQNIPFQAQPSYSNVPQQQQGIINIQQVQPNQEGSKLGLYMSTQPDQSNLNQSQPSIRPQPNVQQPPHSGPSRCPKTPSHSSTSSSNTHHQKAATLISERVINMDDFEKMKILGHGSFGNVYLAKEKSTGNLFAVKELISIESSEDQVSFLREVEALAQAVYPAILHLRGFSINPVPAIVTEYLPGGTLQDVINGNKAMDYTQRIKALYGVASAMCYLHERLNIVHRDLKPANVMLNKKLEPVVCDFGLAKMMKKMAMKQTQKAGSPVYMAPELLSGKEYTNKVDVYSFGILCYELLSQLLAFDKITEIMVLIQQVVNGVRPDMNNTDISQCFRELITRCWSNESDKRPSFKEIVRELRKDQYLEGIDKNAFNDYLSILRKSD